MKVGRVCYGKAGCWQQKGATRNLNGTEVYANRNEIGIGLQAVTVKMTNGSNLNFDWYSSGSMNNYFGINTNRTSMVVLIDANGDAPPNMTGKDIYVMGFIPDYGYVPAGFNESRETIDKNCSSKSSGQNAGYFCLSKVKNNGGVIPEEIWKIKK